MKESRILKKVDDPGVKLMRNLTWPVGEIFVVYSNSKKIQKRNMWVHADSNSSRLYLDKMTVQPDASLE